MRCYNDQSKVSAGNRYESSPGLKPFQRPDSVPDAPEQIYNLRTDPGEMKNLYLENPEVVTELKALFDVSIATGRSRPSRAGDAAVTTQRRQGFMEFSQEPGL